MICVGSVIVPICIEGDDVMYPVLATWMIVRMTVTKNISSYLNIGSYRAIVKYEGNVQLADFVMTNPTLVTLAPKSDEIEKL